MRTKFTTKTVSFMALTIALSLQFGCQSADVQTQAAFPNHHLEVQKAAEWMVSAFQNDDGGYAAFSGGANLEPSVVPATLDAILALVAAGYDPATAFPNEPAAPLDFLNANLDEVVNFAATDGGQAGKVVLALTAAGLNPLAFPSDSAESRDFVAYVTSQFDASGNYGAPDTFKQSLAMLGLAAAGELIPVEATEWLESRQAANGSWDDGFGTADNSDATAMAIMALLAAGRTRNDSSIQKAIEFLVTSQLPAGWEYGTGLGPSANSTAVVVQSLASLGEDFYSDESQWIVDDRTPLQTLLSYQGQSGAFQADFGQGSFDDFYATVQAIPAAAGCPMPQTEGPVTVCLAVRGTAAP